jgi:hypothetical protein
LNDDESALSHNESYDGSLVFVKYLKHIVQYSDDDTSLQTGVGHVVTLMRTHDRWPEEN